MEKLNNKSLHNNHKKYGYLEGIVSIIGNILLFCLKFFAGIATGSIALMADAWHTLSDSASSLVVLISVKLSNKPPDKEHPYGHGRYDLIAAIIIGVLLIVIAFDFGKESIERIAGREQIEYTLIAWIAVIASIILKEAMAQFAMFTYRKSNNESLKADAWHHRSDALSSGLLLIGLFLNKYIWWIDGAMGIALSLFIAYIAYKIMKNAIIQILGKQPNDEVLNNIKDITNKAVGFDVKPHKIRLHDYVHEAELTLHIYLPKQLQLNDVHNITSRIRESINTTYGYNVIVHTEPLELEE
jgi:cation diffusion facilitator family transporter